MEQGERRMTEEELEKEAEEYANNLAFVYETDIVQRIVRERVRLALIDVLEPREKQIQIDAEQIRALQIDKGNLTDENKVLKQNLEESEIVNKSLTDRIANLEYLLEGRDNEIKELEAQIEKMKCCFNCSRFDTCSLHRPCRNYNEWKLRR